MFKKITFLVLLLSLACAKKNSNLLINPTPARPILIVGGESTTVNGFDLSPPYFTVASMSVHWKGGGNLAILAITMESVVSAGSTTASAIKVKCALSGDDLKLVFPDNISAATGGIVVAEGAAAITSRIFGCGGITLPIPAPESFNIPVTVKVTGVIQVPSNPNNTTGRAIGTSIINVQ
ncbi:MAG: hypothetical protein SGI74_10020 [Oligoflexia bacterium]|nr:hypothetical protein [Oligoflexia bacterium]